MLRLDHAADAVRVEYVFDRARDLLVNRSWTWSRRANTSTTRGSLTADEVRAGCTDMRSPNERSRWCSQSEYARCRAP